MLNGTLTKLISTILRTDSYKFSQFLQYPPDTEFVSSYIESRGGEKESVFFGLQAFIKEYLMTPITKAEVDFAEKIVTRHGLPFNRFGWDLIVDELGGFLPIRIQAVPEGTVMLTHNVQVQVVNTDRRFYWLTSYIETALLRAIWYPSTVATKSRKMKKIISAALEKTSDVPVQDQIMFKLHDFGARGASSAETAMLGGMAHLVNFMGTDTAEALVGVMHYYNTDKMPGFSIPASEHSTVVSWEKGNEVGAYENMIDQFSKPGTIYACVSDSYDIYKAVTELWGTELREKVISSGGTLVIRPDSGDPAQIPVEIIQLLMDKFGFTTNSKGYRVLPSYIRVIQGDGINEDSLPALVNSMIDAKLSLDNLAFGMGGGLLQAWNRDTLKYAMKASALKKRGSFEWIGFSKDPVTDHGKKSKEGRLALVEEHGFGPLEIRTVPEEYISETGAKNLLRDVFKDGKLLIDETFETIRERAKL